jgi:hypothetical protein
MTNTKKFLLPVAGAIAALVSVPQNVEAAISPDAGQSQKANDQVATSLSTSDGSVYQFARGNELHNLIVKRNEAGVMMSYHSSHASHASHGSHSSHYSSR